MGIFSKLIGSAYAPVTTPSSISTMGIASPWSPQDTLVKFALGDALAGHLAEAPQLMTRDIALRIPAVKRAHGIHVGMFAGISFFQNDGAERTPEQPKWLTNSASGVSPYHRMYGLGSDLFFDGWGCLGFNDDLSDCLHIPFGMWSILEDGSIEVDERVPTEYTAHLVAIPVGYGDNGLLNDGIDTLREARKIEAAYIGRLDNPVPLTVISIPQNIWDGWTPAERRSFRDQWNEGRSAKGGATAMKPDTFGVEMPGQVEVNLYETGRNAVRLDVANHTGTPASLVEGARQGGGGGTDIKYTGVANGATRNELWDYGKAKPFTLAFEARMSLDDICEPGLSIRGDLSSLLAVPAPPSNPTSED